jgi:serine O-acetyltransferase
MFDRMREDIDAVFRRDPAARTKVEVLLAYPGLHALWGHRVAHWLWSRRRHLLARLISHLNRALTGIEIHPGAQFGQRVFIDHGMGIVVGETAVIGDDVLLYQGVVLGGTSLERHKRHPTLGSGVVVGAGAIILGPVLIGDHARVGAGSVVVKDVPIGATVVGVPARLAGRRPDDTASVLDHGELPDPMVRALTEVFEQQSALAARVAELEHTVAVLHELGEAAPMTSASDAREAVLNALRVVLDPEIGINVVELGFIRAIEVSGTDVHVSMVLTSPTCPFAGQVIDQVRRAVLALPGIDRVEVTLLDEQWAWEPAELPSRSIMNATSETSWRSRIDG